jgi:pimeloyl-ACP methyl ester carboxylesterase
MNSAWSIRAGIVALLCAAVTHSIAAAQQQPQSQPTTQPQLTANVTPLAHIEKHGHGPVSMILIPGLACDWTVFDTFMQRNVERYTMYAVTLPGFGGSEAPPKPPTNEPGLWLDNAVNAIWKFAQDAKLEKPVVVGHSMGGHLALRLGIEHPGEFRSIISIDGAPVAPLGDLEQGTSSSIDRKDAARQLAALSHSFGAAEWNARQHLIAGTMVKEPEIAERLAQMFITVPPPISVQYMADFISTDLRPNLSKIVDKTLIIASLPTGDMLPGAESSARAAWETMVKGGTHIKLIFFDHSRHFIQYDRPSEVDATIADFIAGVDVKDAISPPAPEGSANQSQDDLPSATTMPQTRPAGN